MEARVYARSESLHAPLLDLEIVQVLRRLVRNGAVSARRAEEAVQDLLDLRITRYPHSIFLSRIWRYRNNVSICDAAYVVLAEELGATLITRDSGLASVSGHAVKIELF